ncbi:MAG TPA: DedA family protein [Thermoanaerobacterales bacterium]|nr:DedA family protein [Thermoanaerobacterales bacterium]
MNHLWQYFYDIITKYGYAGLYVSLLAEGTGFPLPVEFLFLVAVYFIKMNKLSLSKAIAISVIGNISGNVLAYFIGYICGSSAISYLNKYLHIRNDDIVRIKKWFVKYGALTNMISRWIGITRTPAIWAAGIFKINFLSYFIFSLIGDFFWVLFWIMLYLNIYYELHGFLYLPWEYKFGFIVLLITFFAAAWKIFFKFFRKGEA